MLKKIIHKNTAFPNIRQLGMECGTTALAIVLKHYGLPNLQLALAERAQMGDDGISMFDLIQMAKRFGCEADGYNIGFENFEDMNLPFIAHYAGNHYVVVYKTDKNSVWVSDPGVGLKKMSNKDFAEHWKGPVINIFPPENGIWNDETERLIKRQKEKESLSLQNRLKKHFGQHLTAVFATLATAFASVAAFFGATLLGGIVLNFTFLIGSFPRSLFHFSFFVFHFSLFTLIALLGYALAVWGDTLRAKLLHQAERSLYKDIFAHFLTLKMPYFEAHRKEELVFRFLDSLQLRALFPKSLLTAGSKLLLVPLAFGLMLWALPILGFTMLILCGLYAVWIKYYARYASSRGAYHREEQQKSFARLIDALHGMQNLKALRAEGFKISEWENRFGAASDGQRKEALRNEMLATVSALSGKLLYLPAFAFLPHLSQNGMAANLALGAAFWTAYSIDELLYLLFWKESAQETVQKINDILYQESEKTEGKTERCQGFGLRFENISFAYPNDKEKMALDGFDAQIPEGCRVGLVGRNGSGKSTLVKILAGFYDRYEGNIYLGGQEIREIPPSQLRKKIFYFPQELYIFSGSIFDNIAYANPVASPEQVREAAVKAGLQTFLDGLHYGLEQRIGAGGLTISGGQKLKIGFARLFLSNPDIVILDEAGSALDAESEKKLMDEVEKAFAGKTIISIAHRLHTLKRSDTILALESGRLFEQGTHTELIKAEGIYAGFLKQYVNY